MRRSVLTALITSALTIVGVLGHVTSALAAEFLTSETRAESYSSDGVRNGCGLEYTGAFPDHTYRGGKLSGIGGSIAWLSNPSGLGVFFKLILMDFPGTDGTQPATFSPINHAFLNDFSFDGKIQCDNPNGFCEFGGMEKSMALLEKMTGNVRIGFNRSRGGMDVVLDITPPPSEVDKLLSCVEELAKQSLSKTREEK